MAEATTTPSTTPTPLTFEQEQALNTKRTVKISTKQLVEGILRGFNPVLMTGVLGADVVTAFQAATEALAKAANAIDISK